MKLSPAEAPPLLRGLPPLIDERTRVLVLGSFPSVLSLQKREYYGNPLNHFWRIMERLFGVDPAAPYEQRTAALLGVRVGVWDVIAVCRREGSGDQAIEGAVPNALGQLLEAHPLVGHIAFNGSTAWNTARRHAPELFRTAMLHCERMPSTSPKHATRTWAVKAEEWARIKEWLQRGVA